VKKDYISRLELSAKSAGTRNSRNIAREIINQIKNGRVFQSPEQKKTLFLPLINSLKLDDVHDVFKSNWASDHRLIELTGNAELTGTINDPEKAIIAALNNSYNIPVSKPVESKPATFPYLEEPVKQGKIIGKRQITDLGITQIDFENGVRLNLKQTDFESEVIRINLVFGEGISVEPEEFPGISRVGRAVLNESGLGGLTKEQIELLLSGKNTKISFGIRQQHFFFRGKTVPEEMRLFFRFLYAYLVDPGFRQEAYDISMTRFAQKYRRLSHSISGAMMLYGWRFLAGGDGRFGLPPYDALKKLSLEHVHKWIDSALRSERMELSVVGNFKVAPLVLLASKYLGTLPKQQKRNISKRRAPPKFPANQIFEINLDSRIPKSMVIVAYPTEDFWEISRTRRLSLLADIFTDRLRERIREKLGMAYSTFAYNRSSKAYPGYGILQARIRVSPEKAKMATDEVKKIASELSTKGISPAELKRFSVQKLTAIKDMIKTNSYWLENVLIDSVRYPQQIDWSRTLAKDFTTTTAEEISTLARKYLDNSKATIVIIKPKY
jgi:zinc protease